MFLKFLVDEHTKPYDTETKVNFIILIPFLKLYSFFFSLFEEIKSFWNERRQMYAK